MPVSTRARNILVLSGGLSVENPVSQVTAAQVAEALVGLGHKVSVLDVGTDFLVRLVSISPKPDVIFNGLHGQFGEDGRIQGVLDFYGVPYTHSGVLASAVAMNKLMAKAVMVTADLPLARHLVCSRKELVVSTPAIDFPYVIKPVEEGSALGVYIINNLDDLAAFRAADWPFSDEVMVEEYIPGMELSVPVIAGRALDPIGIIPRSDLSFYTYEAKYAAGGSDHVVPAKIHPAVAKEVRRVCEVAYRLLGCQGVARIDLRYDNTAGEPGRIVILEVNTQPGLTPTSLVPDGARAEGMLFPDLLQTMLDLATVARPPK